MNDYRKEFEEKMGQYSIDLDTKVYNADTETEQIDININYVEFLEKEIEGLKSKLQSIEKELKSIRKRAKIALECGSQECHDLLESLLSKVKDNK